MNIHETNEAAKDAGMTYGQYVLQTEEPVTPAPTEEPANEPTDTETRTCRLCGKTFLVDLNDGRKKKQIYCSKHCSNAAVRDRSKARKKETPDVSLIQAENRALRTELATNHLGDGNKKVPDQEAKADAGKPRLTLVPPRIIWEIAKVREFGTAKYHDPENWRTVEPDRLWAACTRHIVAAWNDYRATDADSGLLHLAHAATNLAFLLQMIGEEDQTDG